jgi:hypothetical protein
MLSIIFLKMSLSGEMTIFPDLAFAVLLLPTLYSKLRIGTKLFTVNFISGISKNTFDMYESISNFIYSSCIFLIKTILNLTCKKKKREKARIKSKYITLISLNLFP